MAGRGEPGTAATAAPRPAPCLAPRLSSPRAAPAPEAAARARARPLRGPRPRRVLPPPEGRAPEARGGSARRSGKAYGYIQPLGALMCPKAAKQPRVSLGVTSPPGRLACYSGSQKAPRLAALTATRAENRQPLQGATPVPRPRQHHEGSGRGPCLAAPAKALPSPYSLRSFNASTAVCCPRGVQLSKPLWHLA